MEIPRHIHQIWIQGFDRIPEKYVSRVQSIIDQNPGWRHFKWDDAGIRIVVASIGPEYLKKYDEFNLLHQKVDFGRVAILYAYGGVSVDTDAIAYRGFDTIPNIDTNDFICSYNSSNELENLVKANIPVVLMNATILVKPRHPILKKFLDHMLTLTCEVGQSDYSCIQHTTRPNSFTTYLLDNFKDDITILENSYLDPCNGNDDFCSIKSNTVLDQRQDGTWANPLYKSIARMYYNAKEYQAAIFTAMGMIILLLIMTSKTTTT